MSDRVAVMNQGLLEQVGTPEEIYHRPASVFVADFVGTANRFPGRVAGAADGAYRVEVRGAGTRTVPGPAGMSEGDETIIVVRPENLRVGEVGDGDAGSATATVVDSAFHGAARTLRLQSQSLGELTAASTGAGAAPAAGATVSVTWDDQHAWLIPVKPSAAPPEA